MTITRKLVSALCLVLLFSNSSDAQTVDPSTGNLINFTGTPTDTTSNWYNAGTVGQPLTCWAAGGPGYCGPNPRVSAWGAGANVINFSYGQAPLYQLVNINTALAAGGSGVQLSGFNFGFTAKNGNGWDDGRQDYLSAYVNLYNAAGTQVANYDYTQYTNRRYGWTNFNFSETFSTPYKASSLSTAQVGFVGRDNNYWIGPYGPEIIDVNFSLKYTVKPDPCVSDPLSSATCPGYATAYAKTLILGSTVSSASAPAAGSFVPSQPGPEAGNAGPPQPNGPGPGPGPGTGADTMGPGNPAAGGPGGNNPGQAAGLSGGANRTNSTGGGSNGGGTAGPSLTSVLGMISTNQAKIAGTEKSVVQAAETQAAQLSQQAQQQAESVAGSITAQSIAGSLAQSSGMSGSSAPGAQSQISTTGSVAGSTPGMVSNGNGLRLTATTQFDNSAASSSNVFQSSSETYSLQAPQQFNTSQSIPEIPLSEGFKPGSMSVVSDAMEQRPMMFATPGVESRTETVKRDTPPNDLARGIDIAAMALQPQGYAQYSVVMTDVPFYAPKEIYKNQNTVDNVRVLRQLSSDRLHQQLIESQYKQGE